MKEAGLIFFYLAYALATYLMSKLDRGGPCTFGFGMVMFLFMPVIAVLGFLISVIKAFLKKKVNWSVISIHLFVIIGFVMLIWLKP